MRGQLIWLVLLMVLLAAGGCSTTVPQAGKTSAVDQSTAQTPRPQPLTSTPGLKVTSSTPAQEDIPRAALADVVSVEASGEPGAYRFLVRVQSPDTGCDQYADWWEVVGQEGQLIYRRVLLHSHVNEQPFVRSGGPIRVDADTVVWVRAHMNPGGYGGVVFKGSVQQGFQEAGVSPGFAADLADETPLPDGCAF